MLLDSPDCKTFSSLQKVLLAQIPEFIMDFKVSIDIQYEVK